MKERDVVVVVYQESQAPLRQYPQMEKFNHQKL